MMERLNKSGNILTEWQDKLFVRSIRRTRKWKHIQEQIGRTASLTCLEICAGDSAISRRLRATRGNWTTAVTTPPDATSLSEGAAIEAIVLESEILPFEEHTFDMVVIVDALKRIPDDELFIRECHRVLKTDGQVVITECCRTPLAASNLLKLLLGTSPKSNGSFRNGYSPNEIFARLKDGFDIPEIILFNNDLQEGLSIWSDFFQKIAFGGPCWRVRANAKSTDLARYRNHYAFQGMTYALQWLFAQFEFLPRHQMLIKSKRRIWRQRVQPVIKDGRSIAEAAINTKIGTDAPF